MEDSDAVSVLASMITTSAAAAAAAATAVAVEELPMPLPAPAPLQEGAAAAATAGLDLVLYHRKLEAACEEALAVLALLDVQGAAANSSRSNRPRSELLTPRSVTAVAWFLCKGRSLEAKVNAATILAGIMAAAAPSTEADQRREYSSHGNNNNLGVQIPPGVLEALTKLLREDLYPKAIRASLKAMLTLCIAARRNRIKLVEVGVVPLLIELLPDAAAAAASGRSPRRSNNSNKNSKSSSSNAVQELALGILELVCSTAEGRAAVADHALAMAALVHHLHTVSSLATELSVAILWWVCSKGGAGASSSSSSSSDCLLAAQQSGAFAALLLLLQLDCSPGTRVKARELLKLLQQTSWNYYHSHHSTTSAQTTTTPTILCDLSSQLGTITGPYLIHNS
jgi:hypothetical protein